MTEFEFDHDLLVVGGGVNGAGIAADAAGRGLNVLLCEMDDLASATSSASSKLIHGGLRYLEHYEFRLVKEALAEREVLLNKAPHISWPLQFCLPHQPHLRPAWMIRAGLFLYDHLSKRVTLASSKGVRFAKDNPLVESIKKGFFYADAWVDDARLVVLNAVLAKQKGATIKTRTQCIGAKRGKKGWQVELQNTLTKEVTTVNVKILVNAAGPWVSRFLYDAVKTTNSKSIRLVRGSHIVVPKIHDGDHAYILQNKDKRIVFVTPYETEFSLVGTTDIEHGDDLNNIAIAEQEMDYLIRVVNDYFRKKLQRDDVIHQYSGVRPLLDDGEGDAQKVTRDYTFELNVDDPASPLLNIYGGKLTTYRKLSEKAVDKIVSYFPEATSCVTDTEKLPGGNFTNKHQLLASLVKQYPWLQKSVLERYVRLYGTLSELILSGCQCIDDMGEYLDHGLYEKEIQYLVNHEWAQTAEDILFRRTKIGLYKQSLNIEKLEKIIQKYLSSNI